MPATTKGGHQDAWRPAPPLTVNAVLHVFWSKVEGSLGVAVGEVGVGPVTQEERADLPAALGGSLVHGRELPEVSSVDLCTVLEEGRARWGGKIGGGQGGGTRWGDKMGEGKVGGQDGGTRWGEGKVGGQDGGTRWGDKMGGQDGGRARWGDKMGGGQGGGTRWGDKVGGQDGGTRWGEGKVGGQDGGRARWGDKMGGGQGGGTRWGEGKVGGQDGGTRWGDKMGGQDGGRARWGDKMGGQDGGRARWGDKMGGQDGGKKEEPPQMSRKKGQSGTNYCFTANHVHSKLLHSLTLTLTLLHAHTPLPTHSPSPLSPHLQQHLHHLVVAVGASVVQGDQAAASRAPENSQRPTIATQPSPPSWRCHNQTLGEGLHEFAAHPLSLACTSPPYLRRDLTMLTRLNPAARWSGEDCRHTDAHTVCLCVCVCACVRVRVCVCVCECVCAHAHTPFSRLLHVSSH